MEEKSQDSTEARKLLLPEAFAPPLGIMQDESSTDLVFGLTRPSLHPHNSVPMDR